MRSRSSPCSRISSLTLQGLAGFDELWERRTTIEGPGGVVDMLALEDLIQAKKTQLDKDWPMIRRLVEADYFRRTAVPSAQAIGFWLREMRSAEVLLEVVRTWPGEAVLMAELTCRCGSD